MKEHSAHNDSRDDKRDFDSEIAAIALALRSDPEFSSKVKSTPLSDLPTVLADEGFTGKTLVEGLVNLLAQGIDEQSVNSNEIDIQRQYRMSLVEIESEAPQLLNQIIRSITSPVSSEQSSINSIAGGVLKSWLPNSDRSRPQTAGAVGLDLGEFMIAAAALYAFLVPTRPNDTPTPNEPSTPAVQFNSTVNVRTIDTEVNYHYDGGSKGHTYTFDQNISDGSKPLSNENGIPGRFMSRANRSSALMPDMSGRTHKLVRNLQISGKPFTTNQMSSNGDSVTLNSNIRIGSTSQTSLPQKGILKNRRLDIIAENDERRIPHEIHGEHLSDRGNDTDNVQINPTRPRVNQVLDVDDVESLGQESVESAVQDSEMTLDNATTSATSDAEDIII